MAKVMAKALVRRDALAARATGLRGTPFLLAFNGFESERHMREAMSSSKGFKKTPRSKEPSTPGLRGDGPKGFGGDGGKGFGGCDGKGFGCYGGDTKGGYGNDFGKGYGAQKGFDGGAGCDGGKGFVKKGGKGVHPGLCLSHRPSFHRSIAENDSWQVPTD